MGQICAIIDTMKKTLRHWRKATKLTHVQIVDLLSVSHDTICRWDSGVTHPAALQIIEICQVYKCKFDDIIWSEMQQNA